MPPTPRRRPNRRPATRPDRVRSRTAASAATRSPGAPESPPVVARRVPRLTRRTAVLMLVMLVLAISYASSLKAWLQQRDALASAQAQIDASSATIDDLEKQKDRFDDPEYVEQQARARFGYVMPGEIGFTVIDADGNPVGETPELAAAPPADAGGPVWWEGLWSSVENAGGPVTTDGSTSPAPAPEDGDGVVRPQDNEE